MADRQQAFQQVLDQLAADAAVDLAVLSNEDGFLIGSAPETGAEQVVGAVSAALQQVASRAAELGGVDEVVVRFEDHQRLACRRIPCQHGDLILSVVVGANQAYRRISNSAVRILCAAAA